MDSNCDGIDGDTARAVFVSPDGNDTNAGSMTRPLRTLAAAVVAADSRQRDVYAAAGTYPEELRITSRVGVYGGFIESWWRSLLGITRITGVTTPIGDTEAAVAINVTGATDLHGGSYGGYGAAGEAGAPGQATMPDGWRRVGGRGGIGGDKGSDHTAGAAGDAGVFHRPRIRRRGRQRDTRLRPVAGP